MALSANISSWSDRAFGGVQGGHRLAPQHAGHHDIGFFHRGHAALTFTRQVEGDAADPLNLRGGVERSAALAGAGRQVFDARAAARNKCRRSIHAGSRYRDRRHPPIEQRGPSRQRPSPGAGWRTNPFPCASSVASASVFLKRQVVVLRLADRLEQHSTASTASARVSSSRCRARRRRRRPDLPAARNRRPVLVIHPLPVPRAPLWGQCRPGRIRSFSSLP